MAKTIDYDDVEIALAFTNQVLEMPDYDDILLTCVTGLAKCPPYIEACKELPAFYDRDELRWLCARMFLAGRHSMAMDFAR